MQVITWVLGTLISLNTIITILTSVKTKRKQKKIETFTKEVIQPIVDPIREDLKGIKNDISLVNERIDKNERDRLKDIIIATERKFDDRGTISEEEFKYCSESYDKYISLGGNSYIKSVMKTVNEKWKNLHTKVK